MSFPKPLDRIGLWVYDFGTCQGLCGFRVLYTSLASLTKAYFVRTPPDWINPLTLAGSRTNQSGGLRLRSW